MSGSFYTLNSKYNSLLSLFNSFFPYPPGPTPYPPPGDVMTLTTNQTASGEKTFSDTTRFTAGVPFDVTINPANASIVLTDGVNTNTITPLGTSVPSANADSILLTQTPTTNTNYNVGFFAGSSGYASCRVDNGLLTYNPSTDTLSAGKFVGDFSGNATTATNIAGGIASQIPYQTGVGATAFIPNGTAGQFLSSNGTSAPSWSAVPADDLQEVLTAGNDSTLSIVLKDTLVAPTATNTLDENGLVITNAGGSSTHSFQLLNLLQTGVGSCILNPDTITSIRNGAGGALNPQLVLRNDNATGSVAVEIYKNKPTAGVNGEPLFTQSVFGKDSLNNKQEYTRITHTIRDITQGSEEGSIEMGCFIGGTYANMLQLNGVDTPAGEVNVLRPIDLSTGSTGLIKISGSGSTDMTLDATLSVGTGNINISPKVPTGVINLNGDVDMNNSETIFIRDTGNDNRVEIDKNQIDMTSTNGGDGAILQINNNVPSGTNSIVQRYTEDLVAGDIQTVSLCIPTQQYIDINDTRTASQKYIKLDNGASGNANENRIDMRKNQGGGVFEEAIIVNNTTAQSFVLSHTNNANNKSISITNNTSGIGEIIFNNSIDSNNLKIESVSTSLELKVNDTTGDLILTGTNIESGSAGGYSGQHLRIKLNGTYYKIKLEND